MTDMRTWPHDFIAEFIQLYQSLPCLYDDKNNQYSNKQLKAAAYSKLVSKMREVDCFATRDDVIKKINNMRSSYRKEAKKIQVAKMNGETYEPSLWYFHMLDFLYKKDSSGDTSREYKFDMTEDEWEYYGMYKEEYDEEKVSVSMASPQHTESSDTLNPIIPSVDITIYDKDHFRTINRKRHFNQFSDHIYSSNNFENGDSSSKRRSIPVSFSSYGAYVADELEHLSPEMANHCQKIINDAIYDAKCGYLNRTSRIISEPENKSDLLWTVEMKAIK